jgi:hypothetical protein
MDNHACTTHLIRLMMSQLQALILSFNSCRVRPWTASIYQTTRVHRARNLSNHTCASSKESRKPRLYIEQRTQQTKGAQARNLGNHVSLLGNHSGTPALTNSSLTYRTPAVLQKFRQFNGLFFAGKNADFAGHRDLWDLAMLVVTMVTEYCHFRSGSRLTENSSLRTFKCLWSLVTMRRSKSNSSNKKAP